MVVHDVSHSLSASTIRHHICGNACALKLFALFIEEASCDDRQRKITKQHTSSAASSYYCCLSCNLFRPSRLSASQQGAGALCAARRGSNDEDDEDKDIMKIIDRIVKNALSGVREPLPSMPVIS